MEWAEDQPWSTSRMGRKNFKDNAFPRHEVHEEVTLCVSNL